MDFPIRPPGEKHCLAHLRSKERTTDATDSAPFRHVLCKRSTMTTVSIQEAEARLSELIHELKPGEEVVITENNQPVAKLIAQRPPARKPRQRGSAKGKLVIHAEDEQHLEDFQEYMP
jgi:prevent-host-death family protein